MRIYQPFTISNVKSMVEIPRIAHQFNWIGFWFGVWYLMFKRCWLHTAIVFTIGIIGVVFIEAAGMSAIEQSTDIVDIYNIHNGVNLLEIILGLALSMWVGFRSNRWIHRSLRSRGYVEDGEQIIAPDKGAALAQYLSNS